MKEMKETNKKQIFMINKLNKHFNDELYKYI